MDSLRSRAVVARFLVAVSIILAVPTPAAAQKVRIFAGSSPVFAPVFVADQQGYFRDEGLDASVRTFASGAEATEGFRSGAADFLVASDVPFLYLLAGGDVVMIAQFSANPDMLQIIGPKGMKGAADLKGKKVGLVTKSASEYLLNNYLRRAGMTLSDVERVNLAPFDQVPALVRGDVYALSSWKPFDRKIEQLGAGRFDVTTWSERESYILYSGVAAKRAFVGAQPEAATKVVKALVRGAQWLASTERKSRDEALAKYLKTDALDVGHVIANNRWSAKVTAEFLGTMRSIEQFLSDQSLIKQRVNWETAYDWSMLRKVDASLAP